MLIFLELPAKPRRTHLQNIGFLDKISLVQPVGKRTAHRLAVVNADSLFLVDVAPQVPVAPLLHVLHIIDFKYGQGILVDAEDNPQMMCYALGALDTYDGIYDIESVKMTIFQPRRENISTCTISKEALLEWADTCLKPIAELAYNGEGEFQAGSWCQFCKAKADCRKRAEYNLELARYDFEMPANLDDTEIAAILEKADELVAWANDIKEFALLQAQSGIHYEGWKVVEGRSNRRFTDDSAVADAVTSAGYDPYERKLLGITAMTSLLGKKKFDELLGGLVYKPPGKPTLVPESDKRPAMDSSKAASAAEDFSENEGGNES